MTRANAILAAIIGVLTVYTFLPESLHVATQGWVQSRFGYSEERINRMYVKSLHESIAHYNKQICAGTHDRHDLDALVEHYEQYKKETGERHEHLSRSQGEICRKLRVPLNERGGQR
jgi:methylaspartate ammonia-lyase